MDGSKMEGGASHPVGERRAIQPDALPGVDLCLAVRAAGDRRTSRPGPARWSPRSASPPSISLAGAGAWMTTSSQIRQAVAGPTGDQHAGTGRERCRAAPSDPRRSCGAGRGSTGSSCPRCRAGSRCVADEMASRTPIGAAFGTKRPLAWWDALDSSEASVAAAVLFDILEPKQQLVLAQRLGATTESDGAASP